MMSPRLPAEQREISNVTQPCDGMPISGIETVERPANCAPSEPSMNMSVINYVNRVIEVTEIVPQTRQKNHQDGNKQ